MSTLPDVTVEPTLPDHAEGVRAAIDAVARERWYLAAPEGWPLEKVREFITANREAGNPQFVAVLDGRVVGWCDVTRNPREGFRHSGRLGMGVLAEHRRRGIGRRLLEATLDAARRAGMTRVELEVYDSNTAAIALYEKAGFAVEGRKRRARLLDGREQDMLVMALLW
jgi:RimJ/RimL family protein N-acetyltransferase